jgi:hypothetical protein
MQHDSEDPVGPFDFAMQNRVCERGSCFSSGVTFHRTGQLRVDAVGPAGAHRDALRSIDHARKRPRGVRASDLDDSKGELHIA